MALEKKRFPNFEFGRVARGYISCLRDKTISPSIQEKLYKPLPCEKVISFDTIHFPIFSAPEELANHLLTMLRRCEDG